jgi:hypothetical protein
MSIKGKLRVHGDEIVVVLVEPKGEEAASVRVVAMAKDTLRIKWAREIPAPGSWKPVLEVDPDQIFTWAAGAIALDRESGETLWSQRIDATGPALRLRLIGDVLEYGFASSSHLLDKHGTRIAERRSKVVDCLDGDSLIGLGWWTDGSRRLLRTNVVTGAVEPLGPTDSRLADLDPWRCVRVGKDRLFLGPSDSEGSSPTAVLATPDGTVQWRATGTGFFRSDESLDSLTVTPRRTRYVPVATLTEDKHQLAILDLADHSWTLKDLGVPFRYAVIPFESCWLIAGRTRSIVVDSQTGQIGAMRDYPMSLWKKSGPYLMLVDERGRRARRLDGCTLATVPF